MDVLPSVYSLLGASTLSAMTLCFPFQQCVIVSYCYFIIFVILFIMKFYVSLCQYVNVSVCQCVIVPLYHCVIVPLCHCAIVSLCHFIILLLCHCHFSILLYCRFVIWSFCHFVILHKLAAVSISLIFDSEQVSMLHFLPSSLTLRQNKLARFSLEGLSTLV